MNNQERTMVKAIIDSYNQVITDLKIYLQDIVNNSYSIKNDIEILRDQISDLERYQGNRESDNPGNIDIPEWEIDFDCLDSLIDGSPEKINPNNPRA